MSNLVDLSKKVAVILEKNDVKLVARAGFAIDVSGSTQKLFRNGVMQEIINRTQALADRFDDNHTLDMWIFDTQVHSLPPATPEMFGTYASNHITNRKDIWNGTLFAPVLKDIYNTYFSEEKAIGEVKSRGFLSKLFGKEEEVQKPAAPEAKEPPVYLIFETDGDTYDEPTTEVLLKEITKESIYIQFVGVGTDTDFAFLKKMASRFDNVDFIDFSDPSKVTDDEMFQKLLNPKFIKWAKGK